MSKYRIIEVTDSNKKDPYYYIEESKLGMFWNKITEKIIECDNVIYVLKTFISYEQAESYLDYINPKITKKVIKVVEKGSMVK